MKVTILFGSPRPAGNTAFLTDAFQKACQALGAGTERIDLYTRDIRPCLGCMACQDCLDGLGCVQRDGFAPVFRSMLDCDVLVLATPIYAWYCTAPMKALMDRAIYAGNKNYGRVKGPALLAGKRVASIATCGYPPEKGADLWEAGLKRWCRHGKMEYLGMLCRRDLGRGAPFGDEEKARAVREFARTVCRACTPDGDELERR